MDQAHARTLGNFGECEADLGVERRSVSDVARVSALPAIYEALVRYRLQHLASHDAVPFPGRRGLERELRTYGRREPGRLHLDPSRDKLGRGQRLPHFLQRMREYAVNDDILSVRFRCGVTHDLAPSAGFAVWPSACARTRRSASSSRR